MKVLHILNELQPSGAEVMLRLAVPYWQEQGIETTLLATGPELGSYATRLEEAGCTIIHLPAERMQVITKWRSFYKIFSEFKVIHIHTQGKSHLFAVIARLAGAQSLVKTIHNNFNFRFHTRLRTILERWIERCLKVKQVAISDSVLLNERKEYFNSCQLIRNWIDANHFRPPSATEREAARKNLSVPENAIVLVSVGNGSDTKNYRSIIGALALIRNPIFVYFQVGSEHADKVDRQIAEKHRLLDRVHFVGPSRDPRFFLWAADVYLMPSYFEGFGLAAAEALICGLPCVFSRSPGLLDWKFLGEQIKWSGTDAESVAEAIQDSLATKNHIQVNALENDFKYRYSAERGATEYFNLYCESKKNNIK